MKKVVIMLILLFWMYLHFLLNMALPNALDEPTSIVLSEEMAQRFLEMKTR